MLPIPQYYFRVGAADAGTKITLLPGARIRTPQAWTASLKSRVWVERSLRQRSATKTPHCWQGILARLQCGQPACEALLAPSEELPRHRRTGGKSPTSREEPVPPPRRTARTGDHIRLTARSWSRGEGS